jgi:hypothetical protein
MSTAIFFSGEKSGFLQLEMELGVSQNAGFSGQKLSKSP